MMQERNPLSRTEKIVCFLGAGAAATYLSFSASTSHLNLGETVDTITSSNTAEQFTESVADISDHPLLFPLRAMDWIEKIRD